MINNRQNGRRRGRGGGGPRSPNQGPSGNRQENRSRGNAAQLLEKYKSLARDAQMQGDRVQTEYWLQFAEHYFRMLNENRPRFEEQRPRRGDFMDEDEGEEELAGAEGAEGEDGDEGENDRQDRGYRGDRDFRRDRETRDNRPREARDNRDGRGDREVRDSREGRGDRDHRDARPERDAREVRSEGRDGREPRETRTEGRDPLRNGEGREPRRPREPRRTAPIEAVAGERISLDVLPPAIAVDDGDGPPKPVRRRTRRLRPEDGGEEIAPAA